MSFQESPDFSRGECQIYHSNGFYFVTSPLLLVLSYAVLIVYFLTR